MRRKIKVESNLISIKISSEIILNIFVFSIDEYHRVLRYFIRASLDFKCTSTRAVYYRTFNEYYKLQYKEPVSVYFYGPN